MSLVPIFRTYPRNHVYDPFSTLDIWDPFCDFKHEDFLSSPHPHGPFYNNPIPYPPTASTRIYWEETPEAHLLRAEVPGFKKEEVKMTVEEGRVLKISGEKKTDKEEKHDNWHYSEHGKAKFQSAFSLPENCKLDHIKSSFENGVLTITVPKREHGKKSHHVQNIHVS